MHLKCFHSCHLSISLEERKKLPATRRDTNKIPKKTLFNLSNTRHFNHINNICVSIEFPIPGQLINKFAHRIFIAPLEYFMWFFRPVQIDFGGDNRDGFYRFFWMSDGFKGQFYYPTNILKFTIKTT